ncbi:6-phosphogluconolactonase [Stutzerimonas zhaodongensis]|uniref:6-phosphogluconolactonase n=1 Tax=Stutzerimonas zhaodongensis TaxID=1176257 RepID=A0A3M2HUU5_9GAMM|nr:6-phosphogluconolactonase [Stutzerimonas zhaodongensis]MCQ4316397.1 6-phosphogluconolactonase [Stutzerimonas zhaodongensis]RMH89564.1 6-phosphogluconolactonase [Stutzerimonas zhaodongensis]
MAISDLPLPAEVGSQSFKDAAHMAQALAERVARALDDAVSQQGGASLVVSGGRSPIAFFEALSTCELDWSRVQVSLADERWVDVSDPDSNEGLLRRHLLQNAAAEAQLIGLSQPAESLDQAAHQAGQKLSSLRQPIDVLVLGMGSDGHTASLFPASPMLEQALDPDGTERCLPMLAPSKPQQRITMTYPLLVSARTQILSIQGSEKLETLQQALSLEPMQMPIRAFLHSPLEIYWCP